MIKVYRVFNEIEEDVSNDDYLEQGANQYVISILATDETAYYIYPDETSKNLEFARFQPEELEGRIAQIVEGMTLNGEETPFSPKGWAELASDNLGRRAFLVPAYETSNDALLDEVISYEQSAIEGYLATKARNA